MTYPRIHWYRSPSITVKETTKVTRTFLSLESALVLLWTFNCSCSVSNLRKLWNISLLCRMVVFILLKSPTNSAFFVDTKNCICIKPTMFQNIWKISMGFFLSAYFIMLILRGISFLDLRFSVTLEHFYYTICCISRLKHYWMHYIRCK